MFADPFMQAIFWKVVVPMFVAPVATTFVKWLTKKAGLDVGNGAAGVSVAAGAATSLLMGDVVGVGAAAATAAGAVGGLGGTVVRDKIGRPAYDAVKRGLGIE